MSSDAQITIQIRRRKLLESPEFTEGEKLYLKFQRNEIGDFYRCLFETIARADVQNLNRLAKGFPEEVAAYIAWSQGDLYDRVKAFGAVL